MRKLLWVCFISFIICSCKPAKNIVLNDTNSIEVIKFMYLNEYPIAVYEKSFWSMKEEEHATFKLSYDDRNFINDIKSYSNKDCSNFSSLNYAFIIKRQGKTNDTIYADTALRTWKFKINGQTECRYDEKGIYTEFLREQYPFFKDCW